MPFHNKNLFLQEIVAYTPPQLHTGKEWYVGFYAWDPVHKKMRRKKIMLNYIQKIVERRKFADSLIKRLNIQLEKGWNPWIESEEGKSYKTWKDVITHYDRHITKLFEDGYYREDTYVSYKSYLKNLTDYNENLKLPIYYIYQFTREYVIDFLEEIHIARQNTVTTRDNYLSWLRTFSTFLKNFSYCKVKPTEDISSFPRRLKKKQRTIISESDLVRIYRCLDENNKHYLLACYVIYYCFLRPNEMRQIKLEHISIERKTIFVPADNSKNRTEATITLPDAVSILMQELDIFKYPSSYFLFSDAFMPGVEMRSEKRFREYWLEIREKLKLPESYKFYSFKDTGITSLLREIDSLSVRDQARHSSLLETDKYTPHDIQKANRLIVQHKGIF